MIPLGTTFIFYPLVDTKEVEAAGVICATNQHGAYVRYKWIDRKTEREMEMREFFAWDELQKIQVTSIGGVCE